MEDEDQDLNMMLRTPAANSPNQSTGSALEREVTHVKVTHSGASTPTLAIRGDVTRMSLASKRSEIEEEFWDKDHMIPNSLKVDNEATAVASGGGGGSNAEANGEAVKAGGSEAKSDGGSAVVADQHDSSNSLRANLLNSETAS